MPGALQRGQGSMLGRVELILVLAWDRKLVNMVMLLFLIARKRHIRGLSAGWKGSLFMFLLQSNINHILN